MTESRYQFFGDNTKETFDLAYELAKFGVDSGFFKSYSIDADIIDQAIFTYHIDDKYGSGEILCKVCGLYSNWTLPKGFGDLFLIDRPDVVVYNTQSDKIICAAEFTSTVSVGNSQFQRQARAIQAAKVRVPFLMTLPEIQKDRSTNSARTPESETLAVPFLLSYKYKIPALTILEAHVYSQIYKHIPVADFNNKRKQLSDLKKSWILLNILVDFNKNIFLESLMNNELEIYKEMVRSLISGDLGEKFPPLDYEGIKDSDYLKKLVHHAHNIPSEVTAPVVLSKDLLKIDWLKHGKSGLVFNKSHFKNKFLAYLEQKYVNLKIVSYQRGAVAGVCFDTEELLSALSEFYKIDLNELKKPFDLNAPCVLVTVLGYQKSGMLADPSTGEIAFFSQLLAPISNSNVITVIFGPLPTNWKTTLLDATNKLTRVINEFSTIVIFGEELVILKK